MLAKDLAVKIQSLSTIQGLPVRVAYAEASYVNVVIVKTPIDGLTASPEMPGWLRGNMQVIVRHADMEMSETISRAIMDALTINGSGAALTLTDYKLALFCPRTDPITYPRNEAADYECSVTYDTAAIRL